jgi:hypothetical protein
VEARSRIYKDFDTLEGVLRTILFYEPPHVHRPLFSLDSIFPPPATLLRPGGGLVGQVPYRGLDKHDSRFKKHDKRIRTSLTKKKRMGMRTRLQKVLPNLLTQRKTMMTRNQLQPNTLPRILPLMTITMMKKKVNPRYRRQNMHRRHQHQSTAQQQTMRTRRTALTTLGLATTQRILHLRLPQVKRMPRKDRLKNQATRNTNKGPNRPKMVQLRLIKAAPIPPPRKQAIRGSLRNQSTTTDLATQTHLEIKMLTLPIPSSLETIILQSRMTVLP